MSKPYPGYVLYRDNPTNVPADVGDVQDVLSVQRTEVYGPTTEQCVLDFQRQNSIGQTGEVGNQTWDALFNTPPPPAGLGVNALSWAKGEVDVEEVPCGSNWGPRVSEYIASVFTPPSPCFWCVVFVFYCFSREAKGRGVPNPMKQTGSCSDLYSWAKQNGYLVTSPKAGDIFLVIGGDTGHYHTGFVSRDPVNGYFATVEGNSNNDGSSNGYKVAARSPGRPVASCHYVRI
jgi:peptidoglycan hydrolase-like protein with peptidoglycan-binding domain